MNIIGVKNKVIVGSFVPYFKELAKTPHDMWSNLLLVFFQYFNKFCEQSWSLIGCHFIIFPTETFKVWDPTPNYRCIKKKSLIFLVKNWNIWVFYRQNRKTLSTRLDSTSHVHVLLKSKFLLFFFFFKPAFVDFSTVNSAPVHCSQTHKFHFSATFSLKMGSTVLFAHLKIILLQCF